MSEFEIIPADVMEWCEMYTGPKYHALLTDAPFHLTANKGGLVECPGCGAKMARRYRYCHQCGNEMDTEAAKSGFMNASWDGGMLAFQPELWQALARHLHPGAFVLAFASSRGWPRLGVALEDAGLVYQPDVFVHGVGVVDVPGLTFHITGQSFPKSTRIDTKLDARAGKSGEREVIGYKSIAYPDSDCWGIPNKNTLDDTIKNNIYGEDSRSRREQTKVEHPATPLARAWAGHRYGGQILRDLSLPVVVAQKPWTGRRLDCIVDTGAGAFNVDAARVATGESIETGRNGRKVTSWKQTSRLKDAPREYQTSGRWPPNCAFTHFSHILEDGTIWGCTPILVPAPCPACSGTGGSDGNGGACETCGGSGSVEVGAVERVKSHSKATAGGRRKNSGVYGKYAGYGDELPEVGYASPDGTEPQSRYRCARHCPGCGCWWLSEDADVCPECGGEGEWGCAVRRLGEDSGRSISKRTNRGELVDNRCGRYCSAEGRRIPGSDYERGHNDSGTAARFFPNPDFSHETAERLALGQTRKYAAKPAPREKSAGLERFVWRKRKSGHTRIWSDAAVDEFWHWQQERKGLPGEGFDKWLKACGESKRKIHRIPYTWGNVHSTVKSLSLDIWLSTILLPPDLYAPRRLLCPFGGSGTEALAGMMAGWEHVTVIEQDADYCDIIEGRRRFWTGWSAATGETEVKSILKAARKAQREPGQTPQPPTPQPHQLPMEVAV